MTNTLTAAQRATSNEREFLKKFDILKRAAVGVIVCRTQEPIRAAKALQHFVLQQNTGLNTGAGDERLHYGVWHISQGWALHTPENMTGDPDYTCAAKIRNINPARPNPIEDLVVLGDDPSTNYTGFSGGVYVYHYPHHFLGQSPLMLGLIKRYADEFSTTSRRLVFTVPVGFSLPVEIRDDVVVLDFEPPSYSELQQALHNIREDIPVASKRPNFSQEQVHTLVSNGAGMTLHEFSHALSRALVQHRKDLPNVNFSKLSASLLQVKTEAVRRTDVLEVMPPVSMHSVGGLSNLKDWVTKRSLCYSQEARDFGIEPPKGIGLFGPPGTGKSLSAKAIADAMNLPLIKFDVSRVFASHVGQSEERVEQALKMVESMAPAILFIDEVDKALGGIHSGGGDSGVGKRVLGKILTWLQENDKPIFTVISANRVEELPSELLRRGRLDEIFSVSVPDPSERMEVLRIHLHKRGHDPDKIAGLDTAVARSEGYVPAEIEAAVKDALVEAFTAKVELTGTLIANQLENMVPLSRAFQTQFESMRQWAENNARPANGTQVAPAQSAARVRTRERARPATTARLGGVLN
jgi:SpoVK/Ycf46/Vps4 family AAA+-type ATPase